MSRTTTRRLLALGRWLLPLALLVAVGSAARGSDRPQPLPAAPGETVYPLPRDALPGRVAVAGDGSVWTTDEYDGLTRLSLSGGTKNVLKGEDDVAHDIVAGPDGSIWVAGDLQVTRIDAPGKVTRRPARGKGSADALTSVGDAIWIAYQGQAGHRPRIERVRADGTSRDRIVASPRAAFTFNGIAGAPDGSLWFTESGDHKAWIGRMTTDGRYLHWALPPNVGEPGRIAAGADGAMWFTGRHVIARVSLNGEVTSFPLGGGVAPHDIVNGGDGNLWFTSDICLGRITSSGVVTSWPVPGAVQLEGIAAGPEGGFWLADRAGNAIRNFSPSAAAPTPCGAPTLTRAASPTTATVSFQRTDRFGGVDYFTDLHIRLARNGRELFREAVPGLRGSTAFSDSNALTVRDLDGDHEPEVMLLLNWHGAHCCSWSRIYRYDRTRNTYVAHHHFWGNAGAAPVLRDLNGDRRPEFLSRDDRFSERFTSFAGSATPVQIWSYRHGRLRDLTRHYPRAVRQDAAKLWRLYLKYRKRNARGILPAWMADQYLLGREAFADLALEHAAARGELERDEGFGAPGSQAYIRAVKTLLRRTGYSR